jgi:riboflavin kinase
MIADRYPDRNEGVSWYSTSGQVLQGSCGVREPSGLDSLGAFDGTVVSGAGEGAYFVALDWVRREIQRLVGFDPYPGTLNLRLPEAGALPRWRRIREATGISLTPPEPGTCGGRLVPVLIGGSLPAAVVVPDITRYGDEIMEIVAPLHLRTRLRLADGARVRVTILGRDQWPTT